MKLKAGKREAKLYYSTLPYMPEVVKKKDEHQLGCGGHVKFGYLIISLFNILFGAIILVLIGVYSRWPEMTKRVENILRALWCSATIFGILLFVNFIVYAASVIFKKGFFFICYIILCAVEFILLVIQGVLLNMMLVEYILISEQLEVFLILLSVMSGLMTCVYYIFKMYVANRARIYYQSSKVGRF
ncbi:hypothetical protein AB6A40_000884 [Gnathostoma spinigerum]|uniref:Uncharacterized protein n=1 Tax=Gnathostoma spinigerum TaxID=75299 RepID=A0ABD6ECY6_9BILA